MFSFQVLEFHHRGVMNLIEEITRVSSPHIYTIADKPFQLIDVRADVGSAIVIAVEKYLRDHLGHEFAINITGKQDLARLRRAFPEYSVQLRGECVIFNRKSML